MRNTDGESFTALLQEKLTELDQAAAAQEALLDDPIELLRLQAARLVTTQDGRVWLTGPVAQYQPDVSVPPVPHQLDVCSHRRRSVAAVAQLGAGRATGAGVGRGGLRRGPRSQ